MDKAGLPQWLQSDQQKKTATPSFCPPRATATTRCSTASTSVASIGRRHLTRAIATPPTTSTSAAATTTWTVTPAPTGDPFVRCQNKSVAHLKLYPASTIWMFVEFPMSARVSLPTACSTYMLFIRKKRLPAEARSLQTVTNLTIIETKQLDSLASSRCRTVNIVRHAAKVAAQPELVS